jgi:hypothetical protein
MDVAAKLAEAQIARVAIVDDDLSGRIALGDLEVADPRTAARLNDLTDPTREAYIGVLRAAGRNDAEIEDLAEPLGEAEIRAAAPDALRAAAERVLAARRDQAEPLRRVIGLLHELGIQDAHIDRYPTPQIPHGTFYDLMIVDYYLVDTQTNETLPFIRRVLDDHETQARPLQVILMSSHDQELKANFKDIRPVLEVSSSRLRIMEKPKSDAHLVAWRAVLWQLASDRAEVPMLERFISEGGSALIESSKRAAMQLWELDVQAMDLLHELADKDSDDYTRYVEDAVSRRLLSELEGNGGMRPSLQQLDTAFMAHRTKSLLAPAAEIGDSRAAIHGLMHSMEWRDGVAGLPPFPAGETVLERSLWIRKQIRFGMVLADRGGTKWLNITQACDLAQAKDADIGRSTIFLLRGQASLPAGSPPGEYYVPMTAMMIDAENHVLTWNLRDVRTESIESFSTTYGDEWRVVGELRPDRAQDIAAQFGARMARVGLPVTLSAWRLAGMAMSVRDLQGAHADTALPGLALRGHAVQRARDRGKDKPHELHLDATSLGELLTAYGEFLDAGIAGLLAGVSLKQGSKQDLGAKAVCRYSATPPANAGEARELLKHPQLFQDARNADRILVFLWSLS